MRKTVALLVVVLVAFSIQIGEVGSTQLVWATDCVSSNLQSPIVLTNLPPYIAVHHLNRPIEGIWECSEVAADLGSLVQPTDIMFSVALEDGSTPARIRISAYGAGVDVQPGDIKPFDSLCGNSYYYNQHTGLATIRVQPSIGGMLTISMWAYDEDGDFVGYAEREIPVIGYLVDVKPPRIKLNEVYDISISVRNVVGMPVNDAKVILWGWFAAPVDVGGLAAEVTDGTYRLSGVAYDEAQMLSIMVVNDKDRVMAYLPNIIDVKGEQSYELEILDSTLLAGRQSNLRFKVRDSRGLVRENLIAQNGKVYITGEDLTASTVFDHDTATYTILNAVVTKNSDLLVSSHYGKHYGIAEVQARVPVLEFSKTKLTDGFMEPVSVEITDPETGGKLNGCLKITEIGLESAEYWIKPGLKADRRLIEGLISAEHAFWVRASSLADEEAVLQFDLMLDALVPLNVRLELSKPVLKVRQHTIRAGQPNEINIVYTDSHGEPLSGCAIMLGSKRVELGTTNLNGELTGRVWPVSGGQVALYAETEKPGKFVRTTVACVWDDNPPQIDLSNVPATSSTDEVTAVFSVKDDTGVKQVTVNDRLLEADSGAYRCYLNLEPGENQIVLKAVDIVGNVAEKRFSITYLPPADQPVLSFGINTGLESWECKPYLDDNDRTMTPLVPLAEALDVQHAYDPYSRTIRLVNDEIEVVVTAGSAMLVINGNNYTMDTIAVERNGHIYAPLRYIVEALGFRVHFDKSAGEVKILNKEQ